MAVEDKYTFKIVVDSKEWKQGKEERAKDRRIELEEAKQMTAVKKGEVSKEVADFKAQLSKKHAELTTALKKEQIAYQQNKEMKIKEAIAFRKVVESELRHLESDHRLSNSKELADYKAMLNQKLAITKQNTGGQRVNLKGDIGSLSYLNQIKSAQSGMTFGTPDYIKTGVLIDKYSAKLTKAGIDVRSFSQKVGGEMTGALQKSNAGMLSSIGSMGKMAAGYFGISLGAQQLIGFLRESLNEWAKQETAIKSLEFAVEKVTGGNKRLSQSLIELGEQTQNAYYIPDDVIQQSEAFLVVEGRNEQQIRKIIQAAIDFSAVRGDLSAENVRENIEKLNATYEGTIGKLGKYDSRLKELKPEELEQGKAVDLIAEKFQGMGHQLGNTDVMLRKQKVSMSEGKEEAGKYGKEVLGTTAVVAEYGTGLHAIITAQQVFKGVLKDTKNALGSIIPGFKDVAASAINTKSALEQINNVKFDDIRSELQSLAKTFTGTFEQAVRQLALLRNISWEEAYKLVVKNVPIADEEKAGQGTKTNITKGSGSKKEKDKTWLEEIIEKQKKLSDEVTYLSGIYKDANNDLWIRNNAMSELIKKQQELNDLMLKAKREKFGDFIYPDEQNIGNEPFSFSGEKIKPIAIRKRTKEEYEMMLAFEKEKQDAEIQTAQNMIGYFQEMLGYVMEMPKEMSFMLNALSQFIAGMSGGGSGIFGMLGSLLLSLIPGGGLLAGIAGAVGGIGGGGHMPYGGGNMPYRPTPAGGGNPFAGMTLHIQPFSEPGHYNFMKTGSDIMAVRK